jgi:methionine salvage enolase-phosphatase E1
MPMAFVDSAASGSKPSPFNQAAAGAGVSDLFSGFGDMEKAQGDVLEQQSYEEAAALAGQNAQYTAMSTAITQAQENRQLVMSQGKTQQQVAGAGFLLSGSALDMLRSGAQQGALTKAVTGYQGQITEAGYKEQQQSYENMANAAGDAAKGADLAAVGSFVAGGFNLMAAI